MSTDLINRLDKLSALEQRARQVRPEDLVKCTKDLASCVLEAHELVSSSQASPQMKVLQYRVQVNAENLLLNAHYLLFKEGQLETFFNIVPDPNLLNGCVHKAFWRNAEEEDYALAREALRLGAVWLTASSGLPDEVIARDEIKPPIDICKAALNALVDQKWAFDTEKLSNLYQNQLVFALLVACSNDGDHDFVIDYLKNNQDNFLKDFAVNVVSNWGNLPTHLISVVQHLKDEGLLVRLAEVDPDLYADAIRCSGMQKTILSHVVDESQSGFDLTKLPPSEFLDEAFLSTGLAWLIRKDTLTESKYAMLTKTWELQGLPGSLATEARKTSEISECVRHLKEYRNLLTMEMDGSVLEQVRHRDYAPGKSTLCLDSIYPGRGKLIVNDPEMMARHTAVYIMTTGEIPEEAKGKVDVDDLIFTACLLKTHEVYDDNEKQNQELVALIAGVFEDKSKHHLLTDITKERLDELRLYCKAITDEQLKQIRWDDYRIHGKVFADELNI